MCKMNFPFKFGRTSLIKAVQSLRVNPIKNATLTLIMFYNFQKWFDVSNFIQGTKKKKTNNLLFKSKFCSLWALSCFTVWATTLLNSSWPCCCIFNLKNIYFLRYFTISAIFRWICNKLLYQTYWIIA